MTKTEWEKLVKEQAASGKSVARFCRERGVTESGLSYWRAKFKRSDSGERFARVESGERITLELSGGTTIRVQRSELAPVLEALCGR